MKIEDARAAEIKRLKDELSAANRRIEDMNDRYWRDVARRETYYSNALNRLYNRSDERIAEKDAEIMALRRKLAEIGHLEYAPGSVDYIKNNRYDFDGIERYC